MEALLGHTTGYGRFVGETLEDAEERITDTFSEAWMTILRDNPDLCRAIGNMPEDFACKEGEKIAEGHTHNHFHIDEGGIVEFSHTHYHNHAYVKNHQHGHLTSSQVKKK